MAVGFAAEIDVTDAEDREQWAHALVDQWSTPLCGDAELFDELRLGPSRDVKYVMRDFREYAVLNELTEQHKRQARAENENSSAIKIQATTRGWLVRRRYLRHQAQLRALLAQLRLSRESEAVTAATKIVKGYLARRGLQRKLEDEDRRREEAELRKKKKTRARKPQAPVKGSIENMTRLERLVLREQAFLDGWTHYLAGTEEDLKTVRREQGSSAAGVKALEEAIKVWEKVVKANAQDLITKKMKERAEEMRDQEKRREHDAMNKVPPPKGRGGQAVASAAGSGAAAARRASQDRKK